MRTFPRREEGNEVRRPRQSRGRRREGSGNRRPYLLGTKAIQIVKYGKRFNSSKAIFRCGSSSVGRASAFQAEGRGFDPRFPLQFFGILLVEISDHFSQPVLFN